MKYIKLYNSKEEFDESQPQVFRYVNDRTGDFLEKEGEVYTGKFVREYMHGPDEWVEVTHTYHVSKLDTPYIIPFVEETTIEVEACEIEVNDEVVTLVFQGDGYHNEITANTASIVTQGNHVDGYYDSFEDEGYFYFRFYTGNTVNPDMVDGYQCYVKEYEIVDYTGEMAITDDRGVKSDSFKVNASGKMLVPRGREESDGYYELDFVDGGLYYVDWDGYPEYIGRYEEGNETISAVMRGYWGSEVYTGTLVTNVETGDMWVKVGDDWGDTYYKLDGMDEQDPTMYKIPIPSTFISGGFVRCYKTDTVVPNETTIIPGASFDKSDVHYNGRTFNFDNGGDYGRYQDYTWEEKGFTDSDYARLKLLYRRKNAHAYEYGVRINGVLCPTRQFGVPYGTSFDGYGMVFYNIPQTKGDTRLCSAAYVFFDEVTRSIHVGRVRCA